MVRLYKKLHELGAFMEIAPDVCNGGTVYFSFCKDDCCSIAHPVHLDLIELVQDKAEDILIKHLEEFIDTLRE